MARKSLHEKIFSKSPAERTVGEVALSTGDFSMLPEFGEGGETKPKSRKLTPGDIPEAHSDIPTYIHPISVLPESNILASKNSNEKWVDKIHFWNAINPKKWGLNDYTDSSPNFNTAFKKAHNNNESEFVYKGERYNTKLVDKSESDGVLDSKNFLNKYYSQMSPDSADIAHDYSTWDKFTKKKYGTTWSEEYNKNKEHPNQEALDKLDHEIFDHQNGKFTDKRFNDPEFRHFNDSTYRDGYLKRLNTPSYFSITDQKPGEMHEDGSFNPSTKKVFVTTQKVGKQRGDVNTTYVHEFAHKADDYINTLNDVPKVDIKKLNENGGPEMDQEMFNYASNPEEIAARKMSLIYYLNKKGIKNQEITSEHLSDLKYGSNADKVPYDIKQLLNIYKGQEPELLKYLNKSVNLKTAKFKEGGEINSDNMKTRIGKKMAEGGSPKPIVVDNNVRGQWNDYVNWLGTTGKKGLPDLDKDGLGFQMLDQYRKVNPKTILTKDYVLPIQKDFQQYRSWAIDQYKAGKLKMASDPGSNYENFMPELSIEDGYPGSKTTSHTFPNAYLQSTNEDGQTTKINKGFAATAVAKMEEGGDPTTFQKFGPAAFGAAGQLLNVLDGEPDEYGHVNTGIGTAKGALNGAAAGAAFGPIGAGVGAAIGGITGLIGGSRANREADRRQRGKESQMARAYSKLDIGYNANPYGDNNSFYAEEGGQAPDAQPQGPAMTPVNIEKGELAVDPTSFEVVRKFDNKNRYAPHAKNAFKEPVGNHIQLPEETIIIPKKLAKTYESGNNITRRSIIANLLKDQTNREHAEGMDGQMKKGGAPYIFPEAGNTAPVVQYPDWTGGYQQPEMKGILDPVMVSGKRSIIDQPAIQDNGDGWAEASEPTKITKGFKMPHISPVTAAEGMNLIPTIYGIVKAGESDPFLKYDENAGFDQAKSYIEQTPTDVNIEGAKAAMFKAVRSNNRVLNNVNSPSIRAEMASNNTKVLEATGQLYANADNERKNRISDKLGKLSGISIQQGANQEEARNRFSTEQRMDKANREGLIQHGLSEGVTNISKMIMDNERIKSLNAMAKYFKLDPRGKQLVDENPDAVQHIIDQLEGGYLPVFQPTTTAKGKTSTTTQRDARGRVKQTSQTVKE